MTTFQPGWPLIALAFGLSMDAFAVSIAQGAARRPGTKGALALGAAFGLAQGLMPLIGWGLGWALAGVIRSVDHWIAFVLLGLLGAKMLREGLSKEEASAGPALIGWTLLGAAIATSIDAAAAGITLPMLGTPILMSCFVIGLVTGALCVAGVAIGAASGERLGKAAEITGGLVLIAIGLKVLIEHLFFGG